MMGVKVVEVGAGAFGAEVAARTLPRRPDDEAPVGLTFTMLSMRSLDGPPTVEALVAADEGWTALRAPCGPDLVWPSAAGVRACRAEEGRLRANLDERGLGRHDLGPERPVGGRSTFVFPIGPVRGDVMESVTLHLTGMGDEILALTVGLGHKVRHVEEAASGRTALDAVAVVERATGTSTVAHALAFSQAVEAACGSVVDATTATVRSLLQEIERTHSHLWDLATIAASTGLPVAQQELLALREAVLQSAQALSGHRYLRGLIVPGGLGRDLPSEDIRACARRVLASGRDAVRVVEDLEGTPSFLDRLVGTGVVPIDEARALGALGPVGRASGAGPDCRIARPYAAYGSLPPIAHPQAGDGDAWARWRVRRAEFDAALAWLERASRALAGQGARAVVPPVAGYGVGWAEGPRGEIVYVVESDANGILRRVSARSPSLRNWALVPNAAARRNVLQDMPIIDASFGLSVAGADL